MMIDCLVPRKSGMAIQVLLQMCLGTEGGTDSLASCIDFWKRLFVPKKLGGGFNYFLFSPLFGEDYPVD